MADVAPPEARQSSVVERVIRDQEQARIGTNEAIDVLTELQALKLRCSADQVRFVRGVERLRGRATTEVQARLDELRAGLSLSATTRVIGGVTTSATDAFVGAGVVIGQALDSSRPQEQAKAQTQALAVLAPLGIGIAGLWFALKRGGKAGWAKLVAGLGMAGAAAAAFFVGPKALASERQRGATERAVGEAERQRGTDGSFDLSAELPPALSLLGQYLRLPQQAQSQMFRFDRGASGLRLMTGQKACDLSLQFGQEEIPFTYLKDVYPASGGSVSFRMEASLGGADVHLDATELEKLRLAVAQSNTETVQTSLVFRLPWSGLGGLKGALVSQLQAKGIAVDATKDPLEVTAALILKPTTAAVDTSFRRQATLQAGDAADWKKLSPEPLAADASEPIDLAVAPARSEQPQAPLLQASTSARRRFSVPSLQSGQPALTFALRQQREKVSFALSRGSELLVESGDGVFRLEAKERQLAAAQNLTLGSLVQRVEQAPDGGLALISSHSAPGDLPVVGRKLPGCTVLTAAQVRDLLATGQGSAAPSVALTTILTIPTSTPEAEKLGKRLVDAGLRRTAEGGFEVPIELRLQRLEGVREPRAPAP